jgi:AcrR family transcriptional regulator
VDPEPRGRPRGEPASEQRDRIIDAARVAFTASGYDEVTLSSIARDARVSRTVVYEVVGTKEQVLEAVANQVADELIARVDDHFADAAPLDQPVGDVVRDHIRWFMELLASDPSYAATVQMSRRMDLGRNAPFDRARRRVEDRIAELHIAISGAVGVERRAAAEVLSVATLAILESVALRAAEESWSSETVSELIGEFAAGGYLRTEANGASQRFEDLTGG